MTTAAAPWTCEACGAGNNPARTACWVCFEPRHKESAAPVPHVRRRWEPVQPAGGRVAAGIMGTLLLLVGIGLLLSDRVVGTAYFVLVGPTFLLASAAGGWRKGVAAAAIVLGVLFAVFVALFLTCVASL